MNNIEKFLNICRKNFFQNSQDSYKYLIKDLINWLYEKDDINADKLNIYFKKDRALRLSKNPTYLTDGRMSVENKELCFVFNDDLMKKYYKENKYIGFIELIFHEWGHYLQLLFLNNICKTKNVPDYLLKNGKNKLAKLKKQLDIQNVNLLNENVELVRDFAKWLELSNKHQVMEDLEKLVFNVKEYVKINSKNNKEDLLIVDILEKNLIVERKIYAYLSHTIDGEHIIENTNTPKQLIKEIQKFRKWYGGRFVVVESSVLGFSAKIKNFAIQI